MMMIISMTMMMMIVFMREGGVRGREGWREIDGDDAGDDDDGE